MAPEVREVLDDLRSPLVRWLAAGVLVLTAGLMIVVAVVDRQVDVRQQLGIAVGTLVLTLLLLVATCALGDGVRVVLLRYTGPGYADPERRRQGRRLALRATLLSAVWVILLLVGPPLIVATNSPTTSADTGAAPDQTPPRFLPPDRTAAPPREWPAWYDAPIKRASGGTLRTL